MRLVTVLAACGTIALASLWRPAPVLAEHEPEEAMDAAAGADLSTSRARLAGAVSTARKLKLTDDASRRARADLLRQAGDLRREAAHSRGTAAPADLLARMAATSDELDALGASEGMAMSAAPTEEPAEGGGLVKPDLPLVDVNAFHDIASDAIAAQGGLTTDERRRVRELVQEGEDAVARVKSIGDRDHLARQEQLDRVAAAARELQELQRAGESDRRVGRPLVRAKHAASGWLDVGQEENGFEVIRVRFVEPGSAHVTVRNTGDDSRPLFVELEFTDMTGAITGDAAYETGRLEDVRPGEVREVLALVRREHPRFWDVTQDYTIHVE
jgi:hypothetical protein